MMNPGIYEIANKLNDKVYIGSSVNPIKRWRYHRAHLRAGNHRNNYLQSAWNKYGEDAFGFFVLEYVSDKDNLLFREQWWINNLSNLYNIAKDVFRPTITPEMRRRIGEAGKGRKLSEEHKARISKAHTGMKRPEGFGTRSSIRQKGKKLSDEHKRNLSLGSIDKGKGRKLPEEQKRNIGKGNAKVVYLGFISPDGVVFRNVINLSKFCREHGLNASHMWAVSKDKCPYHLGWRNLEGSK